MPSTPAPSDAATPVVTAALVRSLIAEVMPLLAGESITLGSRGWDNEMVRIGAEHVLRLPRHVSACRLLRTEQRWLPDLAPRLTLPVPDPVAMGESALAWAHPWSITRWVPGRRVADVPVNERGLMVDQLAAFLRALHAPAPDDAPHNHVRGVPLSDRAAIMGRQLGDWGNRIDPHDRAVYEQAWSDGLAAPAHAGPPQWIHGDLHPLNVIATDDSPARIAAVIDFSDMAQGDPATDLAVAWFLFGPHDRAHLRDTLAASYDPATWVRARAWAAQLALVFCWHPKSDDTLHGVGRHTLDQLALDS